MRTSDKWGFPPQWFEKELTASEVKRSAHYRTLRRDSDSDGCLERPKQRRM